MPFEVDYRDVQNAVARALEEDIGPGDVTSSACVPEDKRACGRFIARDDIVVGGIELLPVIYRMRGGVDSLELYKTSGDCASPGEVLAYVCGRARTLLECERTALNFMQRLSGVATVARRYVEAIRGTKCHILDTRKTTPGLRRLEKMAAGAGGVMNHRMGLYDAVLIKNNHIAAAGGVRRALERAFAAGVPVEIEVRTQAELDRALACGAKHLLLDNLTPEQATEWVRYINGRATVELSGGITLENVRAYAESGADYISCGAITHSATAVDINFRIQLS